MNGQFKARGHLNETQGGPMARQSQPRPATGDEEGRQREDTGIEGPLKGTKTGQISTETLMGDEREVKKSRD